MKMMQKSTKISEYIWKQKEETYTIGWDDTSEKPISSDKGQPTNLKGKDLFEDKKMISSDDEERADRSSTKSSMKSNATNKKKERRKNPYTQGNMLSNFS
jgi:hypothetical protein